MDCRIFKSTWCFYLFFFLQTIMSINTTQSIFKRQADLDDQLFQIRKLSVYSTIYSTECFLLCNINPHCLSLVYNTMNKYCQEYDAVFHDSSQALGSTGSIYYVITQDSCSRQGYSYSDDKSFCFKINPAFNDYNTAVLMCKSDGAGLLIIDTEYKQRYMTNILLNNAEFNQSHFYIDGSDAVTESVWIHSSGAPVSMSRKFWASSFPDHYNMLENSVDDDDDCIIMSYLQNFKWNDISCTLKRGYICERRLI